jgi:hypothetical protein
MTSIDYGVSLTPSTYTQAPWFKTNWHVNTIDLVISDTGAHKTECDYIKSLNLKPRIDIEMAIWAGGQITSPISTSYLASLKAAGWPIVCSEGGRSGDPTVIKNQGLGYVNYNCDQCGLWKDIYTDPGTIQNLWEAYYPSEVNYILQGAGSGKPNGILAGAWANSGGDNQILSNSQSGTTPSYKSIMDSLVSAGHVVNYFEVWGGTNSSQSEYESLGFDSVVSNLQKSYPPNGVGPTPTPPPTSITFASSPVVAADGCIFVIGSDKACWRSVAGKWQSLGGVCTSAPAVSGTNVFVRGSNGALYYRPVSGGKWASLGGVILAGTSPAVSGNDIYVMGTNNALYHRTLTAPWLKIADKIQ